MQLREVHFREEVANSISHGLALILAVVALPILLLSAARVGNTQFTIGAAVFGATMVILYLASTLYHSLTHVRAKQFFRNVDHSAIFLLIAGSYTPFTLGRVAWSMGLDVADDRLGAGDRRDHVERSAGTATGGSRWCSISSWVGLRSWRSSRS